MAKLDRASRERLRRMLTERLPGHWAVTSDATEYAYVEADQDGDRPDTRFPDVGTSVVEVTNGPNGIVATAYVRVRCPPGYPEARKPLRTLCEERGRGWSRRVADAIIEHALEADAERPATGP